MSDATTHRRAPSKGGGHRSGSKGSKHRHSSKKGHGHGDNRKAKKQVEKSTRFEPYILVIGGTDSSGPLETTELMSGYKGTFMEGPKLAVGRWGCAVARIDEDHYIVVGGFDGADYLDSIELLDLEEVDEGSKPEKVPPFELLDGPRLLKPRAGCAAVKLDYRRILIIGGYGEDTTEVLDLETMEFVPGPRLSMGPRACCCAMMLDKKRLLVMGGFDRGGSTDTTEILDISVPLYDAAGFVLDTLETAVFKPGPKLCGRRGAFDAVKLDDRYVIVAGGQGAECAEGRLASTEVLDIDDMVFTPGPNLSKGRSGHVLARLDEDQVVCIGGLDDTPGGYQDTTDVLILEYDEQDHPPTLVVSAMHWHLGSKHLAGKRAHSAGSLFKL